MFSVLDLIPSPYKLLGEFVVGVSLIVGAYFYGHHEGNLESQVAIANFQAKKATDDASYQKQIADATGKIIPQYIDKWHVITENHNENQKEIIDHVPDRGILSSGWVYAHDSSATASPIDPTRSVDATPSGIADNQALAVIDSNYTKCNLYKEQLNSVLDMIDANNKIVNDINKKDSK